MKRLLLLALAACGGEPGVDSCADPLGGVWRASIGAAPGGGPLRFHIVDGGGAIEIYALHDTTLPDGGDKLAAEVVYSPEVYDLARAGDQLRGTLGFRVTRGAVTCPVRWPAEIRACAAGALVLSVRRGARECAAPPGQWQELVLRRD